MWLKIIAGVSMASVLAFGAALVSKAQSPTKSATGIGPSDAKFAVISEGEKVVLAQHLDPGGAYTVLLFGADW
ncbi:hypothetical protein Poly30_14110 [Planctomycetes bacterium Poly30]|uniref:Alkyl hydroperoxide reductase subunit C/ Thiol specific antioxidant domain-containing protein n=1 Tax=Saltatorellus ferox TaxID=2528018 RepID=A0A518EP98_9BACT|nr:hypothetical protein Poly30_14110 [Planctomycetes bacterium Poly30]